MSSTRKLPVPVPEIRRRQDRFEEFVNQKSLPIGDVWQHLSPDQIGFRFRKAETVSAFLNALSGYRLIDPDHDFQLRHLQRALAERGTDAIGPGIAATDHHDILAGGKDRVCVTDILAADTPVLLGEKRYGEMDTGKLHGTVFLR